MAENIVNVKFGAQIDGLSSGIDEVKGRIEGLRAPTQSLSQTFDHAFSRMSAAIREPLDGLAMLSSRLRETAEIAGLTFAVDKAREYISTMGELGERTVNMAAAVGTTPHQFSLLSGALQLVGGNAETAGRTLERIGKNIQLALTQPSSEAAKAATSLGITQQQLQHASTDLGFALDLLADKFAAFADSPLKSADFLALTGRSMDQLVPLLKRGSSGFEELKARAEETGVVLTDQEAEALAETGEKVHLLALTLEGEGVRGFLHIKGAIDTAIDGLTSFIKWASAAVAAATQLGSAEDQAENLRNVRESARGKGSAGPDIFGSVGPGGRHNPRFNTNYVPPPFAQSGATEGASYTGDQDFAGGSLPQVAPWETTTRGGSRGRSGADDAGRAVRQAAEIFAAGERLKIQEAKGSADQIQAIYDEWLAEVAAVYGRDSTQYINLEREKLAVAQRAAEERARAVQQWARQEAEAEQTAAEQAQHAWADASTQIADQLTTLVTSVLDRTKTIGQAFASLVDDMIKDFTKATVGGILGGSGGASGGLSSLIFGSGGISGTLGLGSGGLFGLLGKSLGIGGGGNQDFWGGVTGAGEDISGGGSAGGGILGSLFGGIGALFGFEHGGIMPSAAGGWAVPQLSSAGALAKLHSEEMVLPADLSNFVRSSAAASSGGGAATVNFNVSAMDGQSAAAFFRQNGAMLAAALNRAWRNGAPFAAPG